MTVCINGEILADGDARVSVFDRGFLFGDGVYEVTAVIDGRLVDGEAHLDRLDRSLAMIGIQFDWPRERIMAVQKELIAHDRLSEGVVYLQISRGTAERAFHHPERATPTFVAFTQKKTLVTAPSIQNGIRVVSVEDLRWKRRDIKGISLLAQVMAKQEARERGGHEAWMVEDGLVTEGGSSTAYIIRGNRLTTRPLAQNILPGITRDAVVRLSKRVGLDLEERAFSIAEAQGSDEAFVTGSSMLITPVVEIDGVTVGGGRPGRKTRALFSQYMSRMRKAAA